ncbi:related to DNA repair protein rhp55 [Cephalotrichum gorgonifer]|uniref:Related to DNA repair protein rhp55 n=1 Tax=Cephalotrichum gorgonifer TaxID=2041049 RepID=A0AAE8MRY7_9PEZI|nr:related to DNA repair protein rhp55 [Cephalotrichum gorgonifer]
MDLNPSIDEHDEYKHGHEHDMSTLDIQNTHRLPAVSAAQALDDLNDDLSRCVSTGLRELDRALAAVPESPRENSKDGGEGAAGVCRGQVTEIWGPPGVGKTAMGIQICASALSDGHGAVWIALTRQPEPSPKPVEGSGPSPSDEPSGGEAKELRDDDEGGQDKGFVHYGCPTLAHLIALLCRPVASSLPTNTAVVVVDSLSALFNEAFPKVSDGRRNFNASKDSGLLKRRQQTLQYVISSLQKLASTRNCAIVLLSQCATRMQSHSRGAALAPAVNVTVWEQGIASRLVLFRDWVWKDGHAVDTRFVGVQRVSGRKVDGPLMRVFAFQVGKTGLLPVDYDIADRQSQVEDRSVKRKFGDVRREIPDSDDEYGWDSEDEAHLPPEPPQWQGSEDLIVGTQRSGSESSGEEDADEEGGDAAEESVEEGA